jgi:DnaJ family protein C protein 8
MATSTASSSSTPKPVQEDLDVEKILNREASAFQREVEVERILKAFKLKYAFRIYYLQTLSTEFCICFIIIISPYDILDIQETATGEEIKRKYRQISLCM